MSCRVEARNIATVTAAAAPNPAVLRCRDLSRCLPQHGTDVREFEIRNPAPASRTGVVMGQHVHAARA